MSNVLLVTDSKSFMISSLSKQLEEKKHNVIVSSSNPSEISKIKEELQMVLIYEEEQDTEGLIYIKDKVNEEGISVCLIGDSNQIEEMKKVIPQQFIMKRFLRPINVKEVVEEVDKYLNDDAVRLKKKILVVDDSGAMLRNVKGWLQDKYQVILANSGAMAIKYLTLNKPDLVLLDYEMPVVNGKQVLEMIRTETEFASVPVIFLTSKNDRESITQVMALKPEGYLLKTMKPDDIVKTIDDFFERRKTI